MTKFLRPLLMISFFTIGVMPGAAAASPAASRWELGLYGGGHPAGDELKTGASALGLVRANVNDFLSVSLQGSYGTLKSRGISFPENPFVGASIELVPRLYMTAPDPTHNASRWLPRSYIATGVGYFVVGNHTTQNVGSYTDINVKNSWGWLFGGGLDYRITERLSLGIDISYILLRPEMGISTLSQPSTTLNFDMVRALIGLRLKI
jgi:hypothetical protein